MTDYFSEIGSFRENGIEVKHYYLNDYHLWIWADEKKSISRFEFSYQNWRVKYSDRVFSRGSENYVMPMFFILEQGFGADPEIRAGLLHIRDSYPGGLRLPEEGPRPSMGSLA